MLEWTIVSGREFEVWLVQAVDVIEEASEVERDAGSVAAEPVDTAESVDKAGAGVVVVPESKSVVELHLDKSGSEPHRTLSFEVVVA